MLNWLRRATRFVLGIFLPSTYRTFRLFTGDDLDLLQFDEICSIDGEQKSNEGSERPLKTRLVLVLFIRVLV